MADYSRADLLSIITDANAPAAKIAAARVWFHATSDELNASGSPIAGGEFDRILDRTIGKPSQSVDLTSKGESIYLKDIRGVSTDDL